MVRRIMLVDDDEDDREFFCYAINEIDHHITTVACKSGAEAVAYIENTEHPLPQLIFLDLNMPGLDGRETLIRLKRIPRLQTVPIVIYSTSGKNTEELLQLGAAHVLVKPYRLKLIVEELGQFIRGYG